MNEINIQHNYEYEDGHVVDCFGRKMDSVDEYIEELNMLMDEIRKLKRENAKNIQPPTIVVDSNTYYWDDKEMVYLDVEGSCGSYGAALDAQGWLSAWQAPDCCFLDRGSESFDDPASAIRKSHSEFS